MRPAFAVTFVEERENACFVGGMALVELDPEDALTQVLAATSPKKIKQVASLDLVVTAIIVEGEPLERLTPNTSALLSVTGDWAVLLDRVRQSKWRRKGQRYFHTSGPALLLASM